MSLNTLMSQLRGVVFATTAQQEEVQAFLSHLDETTWLLAAAARTAASAGDTQTSERSLTMRSELIRTRAQSQWAVG